MGFRPALFVGEAPTDAANDALTGLVGRRIASLAGVDYAVYLMQSRRINLSAEPVDRWNPWSRDKARAVADEIRDIDLTVGDRVVLLGARVADAFGARDVPLYEWYTDGVAYYVRVPHPSGRNRQLNDHGHRARMGEVLREVLLAA